MIEQALLQIREDMARLTNAIRAKGHDRAEATFEVERDLRMCISLRTGTIGHDGESAFVTEYGSRFPYSFVSGTNYAELLREAEKRIDGIEPSIALACEAWFQTEAA